MGSKGQAVIKMDVKKELELLNKALSDEWLAYYQYWVGSKVAVGPMREALVAELVQHATDELRHADMVTDRIVQLGGTPVLEPKKWYDLTNCGYDAPDDPYVIKLLEQNIKGEQCAIETYSKLLDIVGDKDVVTYNMVVQIMSDEVEHEDDLQALLEDINSMMAHMKM